MLSYWFAGIGGPARPSEVPAKMSVGTLSLGYVVLGFHGSIAKTAMSSGCVFAASNVPPPPIDQPATPSRVTSSLPLSGLPLRVFSPLIVVNASMSASDRTGGRTLVSDAPVLGLDVPNVIVTMPHDARKGAQSAIDPSAAVKPGAIAAYGGVAPTG